MISVFISGSAFSAEPSFPSLLKELKTVNRNKNLSLSRSQSADDLAATPSDAIITLSKRQLESILYFSPPSYQKMFKDDPCSLFIFLEDETLFLKKKKIDKVEVDVKTSTQNRKALMELSNFTELFFKNKCGELKEKKSLFTLESLESTLKRITPEPPANKQACYGQWEKWSKSTDTPHICSRVEKILYSIFENDRLKQNPNIGIPERARIATLRREKDAFLAKFSDYQFSYFNNVCKNLNSKKLFCSNYVAQDTWGLVINKQEPRYKMKYKCETLIKKDMTKDRHYLQCANTLRKFPNACLYNGINEGSALVPMPDCRSISDALLNSKLFTDYKDCPFQVSNPSVINFNRIVAHLEQKKSIPENTNNCVFPAFSSIYSTYIKTKEEEKWPLKLCYKNPLNKEKENCYPYVPGNHPSLSYSQNNVISNILFLSKLNDSRPTCKIEAPGVYNPARLKYRTNCWVVPKDRKCLRFDCPQKVILDNKEILEVYTQGTLNFQYYKNRFNTFDQALVDRLRELYEVKTSSISSVSSARFFLEKNKRGIIHGLGCLEDLYPQHFQTTSLGKCQAIPFIIDGFMKSGELFQFTIRTAIDDLHSPRLIEWPKIYSAVTRYQSYHPLQTWTLNGIY